MKRTAIALMVSAIALATPLYAASMDHSGHGAPAAGMDHAKSMSHDMHKMAADDSFVEIGKATKDGVVATVKIKAYDEKTRGMMAKSGMTATHHVMVFFADEKSGAEIANGMVAVKVKGEEGAPVMMMQMGSGFGGDVTLKAAGMYTFEIGTKLADGNKRQFEVMYHGH